MIICDNLAHKSALAGWDTIVNIPARIAINHKTTTTTRSISLTSIDCATLPHAQSTLSRCMHWKPAVITRQQASLDIESTLLHRPTAVCFVSTYVHGEAQTPLVRFVVYIVYTQVCHKIHNTPKRWSLIDIE